MVRTVFKGPFWAGGRHPRGRQSTHGAKIRRCIAGRQRQPSLPIKSSLTYMQFYPRVMTSRVASPCGASFPMLTLSAPTLLLVIAL